jgi:hypothetical protein
MWLARKFRSCVCYVVQYCSAKDVILADAAETPDSAPAFIQVLRPSMEYEQVAQELNSTNNQQFSDSNNISVALKEINLKLKELASSSNHNAAQAHHTRTELEPASSTTTAQMSPPASRANSFGSTTSRQDDDSENLSKTRSVAAQAEMSRTKSERKKEERIESASPPDTKYLRNLQTVPSIDYTM